MSDGSGWWCVVFVFFVRFLNDVFGYVMVMVMDLVYCVDDDDVDEVKRYGEYGCDG